MDYIAAALINLKERSSEIRRGYRILWEAPIMRHFTVQLEPAR
jgi:tryptophanase